MNNKRQILKDIFTNRIVLMGIILSSLFAILIYRLFVLQILEGDEHLASFNYKVEKTIEISGSRGNIYDCNGNLLAYNQLAYTVTLEGTEKTKEIAARRTREEGKQVDENTVRNDVIFRLITLLENNGDHAIYNLPLKVNNKGKIKFTLSGAALKRFKKDAYSIANIDSFSGKERKKAEKCLNASPEEVYEFLRTGKGGMAGSGSMFGISDEYSVKDTLKIMSIRYNVYMNRYSQTTPITVATNVSGESIAAIAEYSDEFPGVDIKADSLRRYNDAKYFSGIIGYTGVISENELVRLNEKGGSYEASDVIGKMGVEQAMESSLQGEKGEERVLVDNLGKVIKTVERKEASVGNDVYLTIDSNLQKYAYNILERRLAGIILAHLTNSDDAGEDKMIPIKDIYFALIDNNVIDISRLGRKKASENEKEVYSIFQQKQKRTMSRLRKELKSGKTAHNDLGDEMLDYTNYIYQMMVEDELISATLIDEHDEKYVAWKNGEIAFSSFLRHAINHEWINISSFDIKSDYYDADEIFDELINNVIERLKSEEDFDKLLYKYMIRNNDLDGKRICRLLYNQGILDKEKDKDYAKLMNGQMSAYQFISKKIEKIEITPAQLALDPCSGSVIITDPETGEIRAMVSYPSYDNNKMANGIDSTYYQTLNQDKSSPMLNRCTQTRTAPGSTFKPITATAVLEENMIDSGTYVKCTGVFDKITPNAKCWIYPSGVHGQLNVSGAIAVSCNYFFYQMGYSLGSKNGKYKSERGLEKIRQYSTLYGLNRKSGLEITEYEPKISDEDAVRSAIGQGTHSYTPSQISRYLTSLVNEKNLIELSLVDKTTKADGSVLEDFKKRSDGDLDVNDSTYQLIKIGMRDVVYGKNSSIKSLYQKQGLKVAGKTGTAQENKNRPNHALFVSYAPYDKPEITMTVVVPNGYTSHYAAEIARDIYRYYFGKATPEEKKGTKALIPTGSDGSAD